MQRKETGRAGSRTLLLAGIAVLLIAAMIAVKLTVFGSFGLRRSGSLYGSLAEFGGGDKKEITGISKDYLQSVDFKINSVDKSGMTASVTVTVPDLSGLGDLVAEAAAASSAADYDAQLAEVEAALGKQLGSGKLPTSASDVTLDVEKKDGGGYMLVASDEFQQAVFGQLEELYESVYAELIGGMTNEAP